MKVATKQLRDVLICLIKGHDPVTVIDRVAFPTSTSLPPWSVIQARVARSHRECRRCRRTIS